MLGSRMRPVPGHPLRVEPRLRRRRLLWLLAFIAVLLVLVIVKVSLVLKRLHRAGPTLAPAPPPTRPTDPCPQTIRIHISGEPTEYFPDDFPVIDLAILSGGANRHANAVFNPVLSAGGCRDRCRRRGSPSPPRDELGFPPIAERPIDVVYRSSNCDRIREKRVGIIRRAVESANFTFKALGLCGGSGFRGNRSPKGRATYNECDEGCLDAKIMIAAERYSDGVHYLGEKLFIPFEHGAIPAYYGNGHEWIDFLAINSASFIDRNAFRSDEDFAEHIVYLLRNPDILQKMQNEPIFFNAELSEKRLDWLEGSATKYVNYIHSKIRAIPRLQKLWNMPVVRVKPGIAGTGSNNSVAFLKELFNISVLEHFKGPGCSDIVVNACC